MSNSGPQINIGEWDPKKIRRYISIAVIGIILLTFFFMAWKDVAPGEQGFVHKPYGGGVDKNKVYDEGTFFIMPWN